MRFRTEIELQPSAWKIGHTTPIVMLGSCFTDEIGSRLDIDGFNVMHNPSGPLYNPESILNCLRRTILDEPYVMADLTPGSRGWHCLDYASRYSGSDPSALLADINGTRLALHDALYALPAVIITLGSAYVFRVKDTGHTVGNCHKFPASYFLRHLLSPDEIYDTLGGILDLLRQAGVCHVIFTVSPIRHLADGLHGNTVSKSSLHTALNCILEENQATTSYFPSYEIMVDDLRDYRFYAADMKHPSETAVDYIYEKFAETFFSQDTCREALEARRRHIAAAHRPIL